MRLSEIIRLYRKENDLSQREFAKKCGVSNGYISMIESEQNPNTGGKISVSLGKMKKLADGMGVSLTHLLKSVDDMPVSLEYDFSQPEDLSQNEVLLVHLFRSVPEYQQELVLQMIRAALGKT